MKRTVYIVLTEQDEKHVTAFGTRAAAEADAFSVMRMCLPEDEVDALFEVGGFAEVEAHYDNEFVAGMMFVQIFEAEVEFPEGGS